MDEIPHEDRPGPGDRPSRRDGAEPPRDVLTAAATSLALVQASPAARIVLAQILSAALAAFTRTRAVRDPLVDTAPGTAEEALAVLAGTEQLRASLAAVDAAWQVTAQQRIRHDDARRGVPSSAQGRGASGEIASARRVSPAASSFSLAAARRLVQHMPGTVDSLWDGTVTAQQASTVAGALARATPETCARIDELIRHFPGFLDGKGRKRLRSDIEDVVRRLEPEASRERAERAARERHVSMTPLADGMARVTAILRGIDAVGMMTVLQKGAESLRAGGAKTSVPALEADLLVDSVLARRTGTVLPGEAPRETTDAAEAQEPVAPSAPPPRPRTAPGIEVGIVITETALFDREDGAESAHLEGYGSIPAHIVRDTLLGRPPGHLRQDGRAHPDEEVSAFFRRLYVTPRTGDLVGMESRARAFPAGLARMIRWRDTTCRTPWCDAKIRQSDHVIPHHRGGATSYENGQGLCARCNLLKEHGQWLLEAITAESGEGATSGARHEPEADGAPPGPAPPSDRAAPSAPATPPRAWLWISPHGAQGISWTPPLLSPPKGEESPGAVEGSGRPPAAGAPEAPAAGAPEGPDADDPPRPEGSPHRPDTTDGPGPPRGPSTS